MSHLLRLLLVLALLPVPRALALEVQLHERAQVTDDTVLLRALATLTPAGAEADSWAERRITAAPPPGESRVIEAGAIATAMSQYPGAADLRFSGSSRVVVLRRGQEISSQRLREMVLDYIRDNLRDQVGNEIRLSGFRSPEKIVLPVGPITHKIIPSKPGIVGSSAFTIQFLNQGRTIKTCSVRARLEILADVVVAAANIRRGTLITAADVQVVREDISRLSSPYPSVEMVVGLQALRTIRTGQPLDSRNVAPPPLVHKGQTVKILAMRGAMRLSTRGVAIMDGRPGQYIRVKNISSNKLVYCRVAGPGLVAVEF